MKVGNHHCQLNHLYLLENNIFILDHKYFFFFQYFGDKKKKKEKKTTTYALCLTNHLRKAPKNLILGGLMHKQLHKSKLEKQWLIDL